MSLPNFNNLDNFCRAANTGSSRSVTLSRDEAKRISQEYIKLLKHLTDMQDQLIKAEQEINNPHQIEIVSTDF